MTKQTSQSTLFFGSAPSILGASGGPVDLLLLARCRLLALRLRRRGGDRRHPLGLHSDTADGLSDVSHLALLPAVGNGRERRGSGPARRRRSMAAPSAPRSSPPAPGSRVRARLRGRSAPPGR